ncbi:hypothetical protein C2845_PM15G22310 [Panicum miliaceum]|uniref:AMP-binding enzyme C-terminal domain-containing protein n=1 Tax=Panicum miliaceum TaxID=4540 RepID=A0A3L6Q773_PANMI|nr:hypothetical protein C2845_PM15G22310 [Panicum miliaceum]
MKRRLKEMEEEAAALREMQAKVAKEMQAPHVEIQIGMDGNNPISSPTGNILTRGLHTMVGYWANNKVDSSDCVRNGWLDTGDTGWVELVLSQHPGVARVVVVGIPDIRLGEKVIACVSIRDGWKWVGARAEHQGESKEVSPQILLDHCGMKKLSR